VNGTGVRAQRQIALVLLVLLSLAALTTCSRKQDATRPPRTPSSGGAPTTQTAAPTDLPATPDPGLADVGPLFAPTPPPQVYTVQSGDSLSSIARKFGCTVEDLVAANDLSDPNLLRVGQELRIPSTVAATGPDTLLLPNSEFVYGPAYVDFNTADFCLRQGGYLAHYEENVGGEVLTGPEIVDRIAHHYSIGPRTLLTILEMESGWVTQANPAIWEALHPHLVQMANTLNEGYYNWRGRGMPLLRWADGSTTRYAPTLNAATAGLHYFFAQAHDKADWEVLVGQGPGSFAATYRALFGDPQQYAVEPLIPARTTCPDLSLPWAKGEMWFYVGGPHGGWGNGSAWAAIDVVPDEGYLGCRAATSWATAAAPGLVIYSHEGEVMLDLDGDGHEQTGWVLFYLHVADEGRAETGRWLDRGDPIGHPSCEGGFAEATHLHFARRFNGEWIAADGPLPLVLSGWRFYSGGSPYDGTAVRDGEERIACECADPAFNGLLADR